MRILVTGASGFIGRAVAQVLLQHDHDVYAAVRRDGADLPAGCVAAAVGDIHGGTSWDMHLAGIDAVVHLAARTHQRDGANARADYWRLNVEGTRRLALAARAAGVTRFVFMSSAKVNGEQSPNAATGSPLPLSGQDVPNPATLYGQSKWEAEKILRQLAADPPMHFVILRPPLVYGPGQKGNLAQLMRAIDKGVPLPLAGIENRRSLIGVTNLAAAVQSTLSAPSRAAGTYTLRDVDLSSVELAHAIADALGTSARLFRLPRHLLMACAGLTGRRGELEKLTQSLILDSERFTAATGWRPCGSVQDCLRDAALAYRARSVLA